MELEFRVRRIGVRASDEGSRFRVGVKTVASVRLVRLCPSV